MATVSAAKLDLKDTETGQIRTCVGTMSRLGDGSNFFYDQAGDITACGLMGNGANVLSVQQDGTVTLWDAAIGEQTYFKDGTEGKRNLAAVKGGLTFGVYGKLVPIGNDTLVGRGGKGLVIFRALRG
jgi:hypothetical protein